MDAKIFGSAEEVSLVAGKVLDKVKDGIKKDIADEFYTEFSNFLYEHYQNFKDKIEKELISEIADEFIADSTSYKYKVLRERIYEEHKIEIEKVLTSDVIEEGMSNILLSRTSNTFFFNWQWKDGIVKLVLSNWNKFRDDERIAMAFGCELERKESRIKALEEQIEEMENYKGED